jgi:hypothetical protein
MTALRERRTEVKRSRHFKELAEHFTLTADDFYDAATTEDMDDDFQQINWE